jgi:hypothetical protein
MTKKAPIPETDLPFRVATAVPVTFEVEEEEE